MARLSAIPDIPGQDYGSEWEIRTYLHINLGM
jgi:hypothetical protein